MSGYVFGIDPVEQELQRVLGELAAGKLPPAIESRLVDVKEEPGRRRGATVVAGSAENEAAASYLAEESTCFANSAGGGGLIVGVSDDGQRIGTALDGDWLRHRIYELTDHKLTVDVREALLDNTRLLILRVPEALSPVPYRNKIRWRLNDHCTEVDAASWWAGRLNRLGYDWSASPSNLDSTAARPAALLLARQFLLDSKEPNAISLAKENDLELLRRLNVVTSDGKLTNAGALVFVGKGNAAIDYQRRVRAGADSAHRVLDSGLSLLEELYNVEQAISASNPTIHLPAGLMVQQVKALPALTIREAIVNGAVHRDWESPNPTTVEHVGNNLVVTSPGGFVGGVGPDNIIAHPSAPRYKALAELMASLRIAEREGIGVDRMVREMLSIGYQRPVIEETRGPAVRAALVGGDPNVEWMKILAQIQPGGLADDLNSLLLLDHLSRFFWLDVDIATPLLQRSALEAKDAIRELSLATWRNSPVLVPVAATPSDAEIAWRPSNQLRAQFRQLRAYRNTAGDRSALAKRWVRHRGRISSSELADLSGVAQNNAATTLADLEVAGEIVPSRASRTGRGFHYLLAPNDN